MSDFVALERVATWAARGESTVIQAAPATCRRRCMRSRSNSIRFGVAATPADKRSGTAHGVARSATGLAPQIRFCHEVLAATGITHGAAGR
jgi:hypothetical protein